MVSIAIAVPGPLFVAGTYLPGHPFPGRGFVFALLTFSFIVWLIVLARLPLGSHPAAADQPQGPNLREETIWQRYERQDQQGQGPWNRLRRLPAGLWLVGAMTLAVAGPTLLISLVQVKGQPTRIGDRYYAESHGYLIALSPAQDTAQLLIGQRAFLSGVALFLFITAVAAFATLNETPAVPE